MSFYTWTAAIDEVRVRLGTERSTTNPKFDELMIAEQLAHQVNTYAPRVSSEMLTYDSLQVVEHEPAFRTWTAGEDAYNLPGNCARFIGLDIPGEEVALYGTRRDRTYNHFIARKSTMQRTNLGLRLVCFQANRLLIHPVPTTNLTFWVNYVRSITVPTTQNWSESFPCPRVLCELIFTAATSVLMMSDHRPNEAAEAYRKLLQEMELVFGVEDRRGAGEAARG